MKRILMYFSLTFLSSIVISAQSKLEGTWHGDLDVFGNKLTLVMHISDGECTMDSPDQGAYGIKAQVIDLTDKTVAIEIPELGASFTGMESFGLIVGQFSQMGMTFSLSLKRGEPVYERPQTPTPPFPYSTEEITFVNAADGAVLSGTLTIPENADQDAPVVLFVSGSGLQDRDESLYNHKPFFVIADRLARNGIASLRYDDRGFGKSTGDLTGATTETFRQDAEAGLAYLKELEKFGKVGIIGHSEGGTIAFLLAGEDKADFIVSLAGTTVSGEQILIEQNMLILEKAGASEEQIKEQIARVLEVEDPWMRYFMDLDPGESISKISCPVMALNGGKDVQVIAQTNIEVLRTLLQDSDKHFIKVYPNLNHLFQNCSSGMPNEYGSITETMSEEVLSDIISWILSL